MAKKWNIQTYVMFDTETTGLPSPGNNPKITELCLLAISRDELRTKQREPRVCNRLQLCINPIKSIHHHSSEITGLYNDSLSYQATFKTQASVIVSFLQNLKQPTCLLAHNGHGFDFPLLKAELDKCNQKLSDAILCADTLQAFRVFDGLPPIAEFVLERNKERLQQQLQWEKRCSDTNKNKNSPEQTTKNSNRNNSGALALTMAATTTVTAMKPLPEKEGMKPEEGTVIKSGGNGKDDEDKKGMQLCGQKRGACSSSSSGREEEEASGKYIKEPKMELANESSTTLRQIGETTPNRKVVTGPLQNLKLVKQPSEEATVHSSVQFPNNVRKQLFPSPLPGNGGRESGNNTKTQNLEVGASVMATTEKGKTNDQEETKPIESKKKETMNNGGKKEMEPSTSGERKLYSLGSLYQFYVGQKPGISHTAGDDCETMMKIIRLNLDKITGYCDEQAVLFSQVESMY